MTIIRKKKILIIFLFILASTFFISCSNNSNNSLKVRVAFFPNLTHSQALVGMNEGQFQKALGEGAQIEWKQFNAGPSEIEALFAGEIDIGYIGPIPAINGYDKSKGELQIIAGATDAGAILVSRRDLCIKKIKELDKKVIAVPQYGNTQDLILRHILSENKLKDVTRGGSVRIIQAENADIKLLLDRKEIDAALVPEPWGSRLIKEVKANIVLDYNEVYLQGGYSSTVVVARKSFIKKYPDIIKTFIQTHVELTKYINEEKEKVKGVINSQINKLTGVTIPEDIMDDSFSRLIITNNPEKESILNFIKVSQDLGIIQHDIKQEELLNLDILTDVLRESGKGEKK